ncbi:MAG: ATP synthase F1 subunit delta [Oscillospiraceae bacterium]|nr:ATP synthase F1 subunit delta [Oscillospiraceae bacterium]
MSQIGSVYAQALYSLAEEESLGKIILDELITLDGIISGEGDFLRLLSAATLSKEERCGIVDEIFKDKVHPYVLNFLKILTEKGYMRYFGDCCKAYREMYNKDNGILVVTAVTASPLTADQSERLTDKLTKMTGKTIELENKIDPSCIGGIRLDYDGKRTDDTVAHRLDTLRNILNNTVL